MPQVLFVKRQGAYWPGANPVLGEDIAAGFLKSGVAVPYSEETKKKIAAMVAKEAMGGVQAESVDLGKYKEDAEEAGPFDELQLDTRVVHSLGNAGFKDIEALEEYATTNENFLEVEGIGAAGDEQIRAALNKRGTKRK